jgi:hypothetical protein
MDLFQDQVLSTKFDYKAFISNYVASIKNMYFIAA